MGNDEFEAVEKAADGGAQQMYMAMMAINDNHLYCQHCSGCYREKGSPEEGESIRGIKIKPDQSQIRKWFSKAIVFSHFQERIKEMVTDGW